MSEYSQFAFYYDELIDNVDYSKMADRLLSILAQYGHEPGLTLDLACGTGNLTFELLQRGVDVYGVDASMEMLSQAKDKAYERELDVLFLCQNMQDLDLYGCSDTVFCMLDSLNHLKGAAEVQKAFDRVWMFLNPEGFFVFDMNTVYKHKYVLSDHTYVYETDHVFCVWQNSFHAKDNRVCIDLDFFEKQGKLYRRSQESFNEYAYNASDIHKMLEKSGFKGIEIYDALDMESPRKSSERLLVVAHK